MLVILVENAPPRLRGGSVFPTDVGMGRRGIGDIQPCSCVPHAGGDGPGISWADDLTRSAPLRAPLTRRRREKPTRARDLR